METLLISAIVFGLLIFAGHRSDKKFNRKIADCHEKICKIDEKRKV
jgi:hypothetical protein